MQTIVIHKKGRIIAPQTFALRPETTSNELLLLSLIEVTLAMLFFQFIYLLQRRSDARRRLFLELLVCFLTYELIGLSAHPDAFLFFDWTPSLAPSVDHFATVGLLSFVVWYGHRASAIILPARYRVFGVSAVLVVSLMMVAGLYIPWRVGQVDTWPLCQLALGLLAGVMIGHLLYAIRIFCRQKQLHLPGRAPRMVWGTLIGLACFSLLPVAAIVHRVPLAETIMAGAGMFFIVFSYLQAAIAESRSEYARLQAASRSMDDILRDNCKHYELTAREAQVVERLVTGLPYKIIAAELDISEKTVSRHVGNIFDKVGVTNKTELVHHLRQTINF